MGECAVFVLSGIGCALCLWKLRFKEELWCLFGLGGWNGMIERWNF